MQVVKDPYKTYTVLHLCWIDHSSSVEADQEFGPSEISMKTRS